MGWQDIVSRFKPASECLSFFSPKPSKKRRIEQETEAESVPPTKRPAKTHSQRQRKAITIVCPDGSLVNEAGTNLKAEENTLNFVTPLRQKQSNFAWKNFPPPSSTGRQKILFAMKKSEAENEKKESFQGLTKTNDGASAGVRGQRKYFGRKTLQLAVKLKQFLEEQTTSVEAELQLETLRPSFMQAAAIDEHLAPQPPPENPTSSFKFNYESYMARMASLEEEAEVRGRANICDAATARKKYDQELEQLRALTSKAYAGLDYNKARRTEEDLEQMERTLEKMKQVRIRGRVVPETEEAVRHIPLPTITDADHAAYEEAIRKPAKEKLLSHQRSGIELFGRDAIRMKPGAWLNDELINLYMSMLLERDSRNRVEDGDGPRCHFFNSFFLNKLYQDAKVYNYNEVRRWSLPIRLKSAGQLCESILDCDRIIIPMNQGNMHWVCAVIDLQNKKLIYYDSLAGEDHKCLDNLARYLVDEFKNKRKENRSDIMEWPRLFPKNIPQQMNGCDCGVFTMLFADYAGLNAAMNFSQDDIQNFRVKIMRDFLRQKVE